LKFLLYIVILLNFSLQAQTNLVPNGSFEEYDDCPSIGQSNSQFNNVHDWFRATEATPDYHNYYCNDANPGVLGVPINYGGYQQAYNGNAYVGILFYADYNVDYREYIEVKLDSVLTLGIKYYWSFYVSLAEDSKKAVNNINITFSEIPVIDLSITTNLPLNGKYQPTIYFTDTSKWAKISGQFIAEGNEEYLIIGNFQPDSLIELIDVPLGISMPVTDSYYYIDNVCVNSSGLCNSSQISIPNVFTPNNDGINDLFEITYSNIENINITVYNRWGSQVFFGYDNFNWDGTNELQLCSTGVYFYIINYTNIETKEFEQKQGYIHLLR
jgi:gliding motility-associated-like protein